MGSEMCIRDSKSNNKFNVNMDFLMSLKNTKGVTGIKEINEKKY